MKVFTRIGVAMLAVMMVTGFATAAMVTFNVDMSHQETLGNFDPVLDGVGIRGDMNGWGGADGLEDLDLDMVYTTTLELDSGAYNYKFVIWFGNDPENVGWENGINNRNVAVDAEDITLETVWFDNDSPVVTNYEITFRVNMDEQVNLGVFDPATDAMVIRGGRPEIGNWDGYTAVPRLAESMIYSVEIQFDDFEPGNQLDYKFVIDYDNDGMDPVEWEQVGGPFDNRSVIPDGTEPDDDADTYLEISLEPAWFSLAEPSALGSMYIGPYQTTIGPDGGPIGYEFMLHNNLTNPFAAHIWLSAVLPNGGTVNLAPMPVTVQPGETIFMEDLTVDVPPTAPEGTYIVSINAGNYPTFIGASDSFTLTKTGVAAGSSVWGQTGLGEQLTMADETTEVGTTPSEFALNAAYPNPFNPTTSVAINLPEAAELNVSVFNVQGRLVATLAQGSYNAGQHTLTFDASNLASGVYFVRAEVPGQLNAMQKITLMK